MSEKPPRSWVAWLLIGVVVLYALALIAAPVLTIVGSAFSEGVQPIFDALTTPDADPPMSIWCAMFTANPSSVSSR